MTHWCLGKYLAVIIVSVVCMSCGDSNRESSDKPASTPKVKGFLAEIEEAQAMIEKDSSMSGGARTSREAGPNPLVTMANCAKIEIGPADGFDTFRVRQILGPPNEISGQNPRETYTYRGPDGLTCVIRFEGPAVEKSLSGGRAP